MHVIIVVLSTIVAINALLLIGIILIQQSKGGGLTSSAFGGAGDAVFGAHAGAHLTKLTVMLTASFFVLTLALAIVTGHRGTARSVVEQVEEAQVEQQLEKPVESAAESPVASSEDDHDLVADKEAAGRIGLKPATPTSSVAVPSASPEEKPIPAEK